MRKMKKFAKGGSSSQARYDRKIADIESDFAKASKGKTGRAAEVARAKYDQRMADAKDDLAKWTGADRTQTRAGEKAAERELTMTRRYGARKIPALEDTGPAVRPMAAEDISAAVGAAKPKATASAPARPKRRAAASARTERRAPPSSGAAPSRTPSRAEAAPETKDTREIVVTGKKSPRGGPEDPSGPAARRARLGNALGAPFRAFAKYNPLSLAASAVFDGEPSKPSAPAAPKPRSFTAGQQAKLAQLKAAAEAPGASRFAKDRYRMARETGMVGNAKGGKVKGYAKGGKIDGCAVRGKTKMKRK